MTTLSLNGHGAIPRQTIEIYFDLYYGWSLTVRRV